MAIDAKQIKCVIQAAVTHALQESAADSLRRENKLRQTIQELASQVAAVQVAPPQTEAPQIKVYRPIEIKGNVACNEPLDAVKCLPEFAGTPKTYVSWRQAAVAAYYIFRRYGDSSRHYQAVIIIRCKIKGSADAVLSSFGTVLNFDAIINRLDFTYSDKRPIHVIEQELGTLRQGSLTLLQYYDEVEKKLTLLTNKAIMSYEPSAAKVLCDKFRDDALRVFISGLKRSLTNMESYHERYTFATSFASSQEDKGSRPNPITNRQEATSPTYSQVGAGKNPHFTKQYKGKYDRNQNNQEHGERPIPAHVGEILLIDIFSTDKKYFLTCIDKFSKFAVVQPIPSRTIEDLKLPLLQLMNFFPKAKVIYCDNEPPLNSHTIIAMLENHFGVGISNALPLHSVSNGQVDRFHSTLIELARCLKIGKGISDTVELILLATAKYNKSFHSVIDKKPADVLQARPDDPK